MRADDEVIVAVHFKLGAPRWPRGAPQQISAARRERFSTDSAEAGGSTMTKHGIRWTLLIVPLALGALAPQFAQEGPKGREPPDQQSSLHSLMAGFIRTINTAEATYYIQNRSYASWKSLLENHEQQQYLNGWLTQFYPQFFPRAAKTDFGTPPEVLPGLNLRLNVAPDGRSYI